MNAAKGPICLTCTCEGTMLPDREALARAGLDGPATATQLCRAELGRFRAALAEGRPVVVACTQEAPLLREVAEAEAPDLPLGFANIRETAGWTAEARESGPKMAALLAAAAVTPTPFAVTTLQSAGVALLLGSGEEVLQAARSLAESLDITVLLLPGTEVQPPRTTEFPVLQGRVSSATGHLGSFELVVDSYAQPLPSSRDMLRFGPARDGAISRADLVVDLTGGRPLFSADDLRPGYLRADPRDPAAVARVVAKAQGMVGTFDKPLYIDFSADLCAHARNRITGCTRCLDLCPTGAISPGRESVLIDPAICAGCGQCAAACPTGAASYTFPSSETLLARLRASLSAWHAAGGTVAPAVLFHDDDHGTPLIEASGRFGRGIPSHVIPVVVNEITQIGPEVIAATFAWGAGAMAILGRGRRRHDLTGLERSLALVRTVAETTGHGPIHLIETDDPDTLEAATADLPRLPTRSGRSSFLPPSDKRGQLTMAFAEMNRAGTATDARFALDAGAPFGTVELNVDACTLCMACVGACPTGALLDNPETPMLRFTETACVQCGLCVETCPENALSLSPRIDFAAWETPRRLLKEEEPHCCPECGKAFATRSGISRVQSRLTGHWMFTGEAGAARLKLLELCEDCRVREAVRTGFDPHEGEQRKVLTTNDFLRARENPTD